MIEYFDDWRNITGTFQELTSTKNSAGQPIESWSTVTGGENIKLNFWVDSQSETNTQDKFVGKKLGSFLVSVDAIPFEPTSAMRVTAGSKIYDLIESDNIAEFDDFYHIQWVLTNG